MKILTTIADAQAQLHAKRRVLVPTMGALHKAHGELIRVAREASGKDGEVAVSIFVNPLQFEPGSDYERYPRPEKTDEEFCRNAGVDLLFRPSADEVYRKRSLDVRGRDFRCRARWKANRALATFAGFAQSSRSCSTFSRRDAAVFGEKDFQQLAVLRRMVRDLNFNIDIIAVPTVRDEDGLACSSRNQYLNSDERKQAAGALQSTAGCDKFRQEIREGDRRARAAGDQ